MDILVVRVSSELPLPKLSMQSLLMRIKQTLYFLVFLLETAYFAFKILVCHSKYLFICGIVPMVPKLSSVVKVSWKEVWQNYEVWLQNYNTVHKYVSKA